MIKYKSFHNWILENITDGSNMLEFGSGPGTKLFTEKFNVTSIEHDKKYLNIDPKSNYIYAPIINGWYDISKLQNLNKKFDLILIDGPTGVIGRSGLLDNLKLFNWDSIIVMDDVNRKNELDIMKKLVDKINASYKIYDGENRSFAIIKKELN